MIITSEDVGEDFLFYLNKLVKIRKDKRLIYLDTYLEDEKDFLLSQLENKIKRIKLHLQNNTKNNNIEKAEDNCLDAAIYALFLCSVINNE